MPNLKLYKFTEKRFNLKIYANYSLDSKLIMSQSDQLPPTYIEGWSNLESVRSIPYRRLGQTDMIVSLLTLGEQLFFIES